MNPKSDIIFGKQKLVFNSAKNKYDNNEDIKENILINSINNIESISFIGSDSCETMASTPKFSRDSNNSNFIINNIKMPISGFLGENKKPNEKKIYQSENQNNLLTLQIKYVLNKISEEYYDKNLDLIKSPICDFYCNYNYKFFNNNIDNYIFNNTINNNIINNKIINNKTINNNEKRIKNMKFNTYYNKFSFGFTNNNYKNCK